MAEKFIIIRNHNGTDWDELLPKTAAVQVVTSPDERFTSDTEMAGKASVGHTHTVANVTGLQTTLDGKAPTSHTHTVANVTGLQATLDEKELASNKGKANGFASLDATTKVPVAQIPDLTLTKITNAGTAASKNTGTASGQVPILDGSGKLDTSILPGLALTTTHVVATQAAMLALVVETGDLCVRTDLSKTFVLKAMPASSLANWQELLNPSTGVASVAGKTGVVTLTSADVGLGNVPNETKAQTLASAALTGTPTAPTATAGTKTTQIATTAFVDAVKTAIDTEVGKKANLASPNFTGTPTMPSPNPTTNSNIIATTAFVKTVIEGEFLKSPKTHYGSTPPVGARNGDYWFEEITVPAGGH